MFNKITRKNLDKFLAKYATSEKVLDIGSGNSSYGKFFPNRISVDIDPKRKPDIIADFHNLPFKNGEAGIVLTTEVFEHLKDPRKAVEEIKRVLKDKGLVILTTRFVFPIHDAPNDFWRFTKYGLRELFKDFEIIELVPEAVGFSVIAILLQRIGYQMKLFCNKPVKLILYTLSIILNRLNWLIKTEYGDISKKSKEEGILASGYYMVARKK